MCHMQIMILVVLGIVGISGYAVAVSCGPKLTSGEPSTVAFAAASVSVFAALVGLEPDKTSCRSSGHASGLEQLPTDHTSWVQTVNGYLCPRSVRCCCGAISPA